MRNLPEQDRLARLRQYLELWEGAPRSGKISDEERERDLVDHIVRMAAPEVNEVVLEDQVARVFCDLRWMDEAVSVKEWVLVVIIEGIKRVGDIYAENRDKSVDEYVKRCVVVELANLKEKLRSCVFDMSGEDILFVVFDWFWIDVVVLFE